MIKNQDLINWKFIHCPDLQYSGLIEGEYYCDCKNKNCKEAYEEYERKKNELYQ